MKRIIKGVFLFALCLIFICPLKTCALTEQTSFVSINNVQSLEVGNLSFSNISFKDYSSISTQALGLTGKIINKSNKNISYTSEVYYYDSNYDLIAQGYNLGTSIPGTSEYNQMSNLSILGSHNINEIQYYRLLISIDDNTDLSSNDLSLTPSKNPDYKYHNYVIDKYDVNIVVNENNTFDITETITAYFNVSKHGIIRTIPLKNNITRLDGTTSTNRAQVINLNVDNEYTTTKSIENLKVKIGSPYKTLVGEQTYIIKYTYNIGKDPIKDYDEIYYNIIGNEWDTVIGNITFTITMPKEFDSSKLGFSSGKIGSTINSNIVFNVSNNVITGNYNGILGDNEGLTIRCELPEGYFTTAKFVIEPLVILMCIIPFLGLLISFIMWYKFGRDDQVVETIEFYPPKGFNSLEVGFLYKGKADEKDVTSLLIYLANKGYIKITEFEDKLLDSKSKEFRITKLKDYDGDNVNEQIFFNGLFSKDYNIEYDKIEEILQRNMKNEQNTDYQSTFIESIKENISKIDSVTSMDLYNDFYTTMNKILSNINSKKNKSKIFVKGITSKSFIILLLMIISLLITIFVPTIAYSGTEYLEVTIIISVMFLTFLALYIFGNISLFSRLFFLAIMILTFLPFFAFLPIGKVIISDFEFLFGGIVGILCLIGMVIFFKLMPKRTKYGNEILGKIKGFKNFLEVAEKEKLDEMVMKDPYYFYDILPYTYVLGVSDKWIKKFESISLQAPTWYDSTDDFDFESFGNFMNSTMITAQNVMSSNPLSISSEGSSSGSGGSSSGGSSGGGSSGGGSGGGGGSSW